MTNRIILITKSNADTSNSNEPHRREALNTRAATLRAAYERATVSERGRGSRAVQMHVIVARDRAWTCFGPGTDHNADGLVSLGGTDRECYYVPQL